MIWRSLWKRVRDRGWSLAKRRGGAEDGGPSADADLPEPAASEDAGKAPDTVKASMVGGLAKNKGRLILIIEWSWQHAWFMVGAVTLGFVLRLTLPVLLSRALNACATN